jgi:predicted amidohydrolase YtcJ
MGAPLGAGKGEEVVDAHGGALIPGLHDHHVHLLSLAAARQSVTIAPPVAGDRQSIAVILAECDRRLPPGQWIRCVDYDDAVAGPLDRQMLDGMVADRPIRVQHRSGAMWVLNSVALARAAVDRDAPPGIERAADGSPTGRVYGLDAWLRDRIGGRAPALATVIEELSSYGVTGVTDATPSEREADVEPLANAVTAGAPLRVVAMSGVSLASSRAAPLSLGPVKIIVADHAIPSVDELADGCRAAHRAGRPVAIHSVTLASLLVALAAWREVGAAPGDRLEHGAVVPPEQAAELAALGITVVTQPAFVADRGDAYLERVDRRDLPYLYPCRMLLEAGVAVGFSTDAPFGDPDPWRAIAAAVMRTTASGRTLGFSERIEATAALARFLTYPDSPGGPPRRVAGGVPADFCLLADPLAAVLAAPSSEAVVATIFAGEIAWSRS